MTRGNKQNVKQERYQNRGLDLPAAKISILKFFLWLSNTSLSAQSAAFTSCQHVTRILRAAGRALCILNILFRSAKHHPAARSPSSPSLRRVWDCCWRHEARPGENEESAAGCESDGSSMLPLFGWVIDSQGREGSDNQEKKIIKRGITRI